MLQRLTADLSLDLEQSAAVSGERPRSVPKRETMWMRM
jgi:hypothetical protein